MKYRDKRPALSLDDLSTAWLRRRVTDLKAMPGLNNTLGSIQMEADILAFKHPVFPPYSAGGELTGYTFLGQRHLAQVTDWVKIRWKAYEVERECSTGSWFLSSRTALHPTEPLVVVSLTITNTTTEQKSLDIGFLLSGRSRNTGERGYAWAVPEVPTAVSSFSSTEGLYQNIEMADISGTLLLGNDAGNGYSAQSFSPAPDSWERGQIARFQRDLKPGEEFVLNFSSSFHENQEKALHLVNEWKGREKQLLITARHWWEELWEAAFTVGNSHFSGNAPILESSRPELLKLYYMAILTEITCRRKYPEAVVIPSYLTLWPRRGEGSTYLTWEMPYISGLLSKLDPDGLEGLWNLTAQAPFLDSQVANLFEGSFGGWTCCGHPQTILTGALNLQRWAGNVNWKKSIIIRQKKKVEGFEAASQNQILHEEAGSHTHTRKMTGWEVFKESLYYHRSQKVPQSSLADVGNRDAYLECVTDYAHGTAALTAIQIWALKESAALTGESYDEEIQRLLKEVLALYREGKGYFSCRFSDGRVFDAPNLYDVGVVLSTLGDELPAAMVTEIAEFVRDNLITKTWCHNLWPLSLDVVSGLRCDHQWAGSFSAWPAQFVLGLAKSGYEAPWVEEWLQGMSAVTAQGPFGQAYWAEDIYTPEAGGAAKCFDELSQGNHWVIQSGVHFFDMVVEGLLGVQADIQGNVSLKGGLSAYQKESSLYNIRTHGNLVHVVQGTVETEEG
ncbi:MAG: hypothetical protein HQ557_04390 [Bacteroidetes bacterium]|nr:hypothetical protein [Bacteroidota bacterium]